MFLHLMQRKGAKRKMAKNLVGISLKGRQRQMCIRDSIQ